MFEQIFNSPILKSSHLNLKLACFYQFPALRLGSMNISEESTTSTSIINVNAMTGMVVTTASTRLRASATESTARMVADQKPRDLNVFAVSA